MKQPIKRGKIINKKSSPKTKVRLRKPNGKLERQHPKFGTSKLEQDFARDFLDKLGIKYIWQFEARSIGRWYDFYLPEHNLLIEIDGDWYHSNPYLVKEENMNPMQKHNKRVDEHKNKWALMHGIPLIRFWEKDIRENPSGVMKTLKERLYIEDKEQEKKNNKNKRHRNILK